MRVRRLWPAAALLLVPALAACGDDEKADPDTSPASSDTVTPSPSVSSSAPTESSEATGEPPASEPLPPACDLISSDDIAKEFGLEFAEGRSSTGTASSNDVEWTSTGCKFESAGVVDVAVKVTGPDDFTKGDFSCVQPSDILAIVAPVDDIAGADEGWWKTSEAPPLEATMRACSATANVDIEIDYEDGVNYDGDPRNQSVALAELVLSALQG